LRKCRPHGNTPGSRASPGRIFPAPAVSADGFLNVYHARWIDRLIYKPSDKIMPCKSAGWSVKTVCSKNPEKAFADLNQSNENDYDFYGNKFYLDEKRGFHCRCLLALSGLTPHGPQIPRTLQIALTNRYGHSGFTQTSPITFFAPLETTTICLRRCV